MFVLKGIRFKIFLHFPLFHIFQDFDSDSEWNVSPVSDDDVPAKPKPKGGAGKPRGAGHVDASVSSSANTYGTSLWGSSSKGV